jgi:SAM-dependent methyltransferase
MTENREVRKRFSLIKEDYAFFEAHTSEAEMASEAFRAAIESLRLPAPPVRVLDFGCGSGAFLDRLIARSVLGTKDLAISLVEPDDAYRREAETRLRPHSRHPVTAWRTLPQEDGLVFDLVLSNHVLYYVGDLESVVTGLLATLRTDSAMIVNLAGPRNHLIQCWDLGFSLLGRPVPYFNAADVEAVLVRAGTRYAKGDVVSRLSFEDSSENRLKIVRFLMGEHFEGVPVDAVLGFFDAFQANGRIEVPQVDELFLLTA